MLWRLVTSWNKQRGAEQLILADQFSVGFDFFGFSDVFISDRRRRNYLCCKQITEKRSGKCFLSRGLKRWTTLASVKHSLLLLGSQRSEGFAAALIDSIHGLKKHPQLRQSLNPPTVYLRPCSLLNPFLEYLFILYVRNLWDYYLYMTSTSSNSQYLTVKSSIFISKVQACQKVH